MTEAELAYYASWASIASLFVSVFSLIYVRSIKANIIKFRRLKRVRQLLEQSLFMCSYQFDLSPELNTKLAALKRNLPVYLWSRLSAKGRITIELHRSIDAGDVAALQEVIRDWLSYSEEI